MALVGEDEVDFMISRAEPVTASTLRGVLSQRLVVLRSFLCMISIPQ